MGISDFFSSVAINFRDRYLEKARLGFEELAVQRQLPEQLEEPNENNTYTAPVDRYEPSGLQPLYIQAEPQKSESEQKDSPEDDVPADDAAEQGPVVVKSPDGSLYFRRQASLDFRLDLRFELGAFTQTVERLAEGGQTVIDEIAAAGFGFRAAFDAKGVQVVETIMTEDADVKHLKTRSSMNARSLSMFSAQSRDFAMRSFSREATSIKSKLDVKNHDGMTRAVNRFAVRFTMDNQFSMAFAQRFNVQTQQVAEQSPDSVGPYVNAAGAVAEKGSSEMMATFFDAVDSYLDQTEEKLVESVTSFFEMAAEQLGFSGELTELAKESLVSSITGFFDRVETSIELLEDRFTGTTVVPDAPAPETALATEPAANPTLEILSSMTDEFMKSEPSEEQKFLAFA